MKCIVIDDLPIARKGMKRLISQRNELELVGSFESAEEGMRAIEEKDVELAFLDIRMSGMSGMEMARRLPPKVMVVFTTAFSEYAVESYDIEAIDYLVKPIDPDRFNRAVDKALAIERRRSAEIQLQAIVNAGKDFITIKADRRYVRIKYDDIRFIEGSRDVVIFHLAEENITTRTTLKTIDDHLPPTKFIRVNKSFIANKDKITSFNSTDVFIGQYEISIGPKYHEEVMKYLLE